MRTWQLIAAHIRATVPFLTEALATIPLVESNKIQVAGTDGRAIMVNPQGFLQVVQLKNAVFPSENAAKAFVLMHECGHLVMKSNARRMWRNPEKWNRATDYVINLFTLELFRFPPFNYSEQKIQQLAAAISAIGYLDFKYRGMDAEAVYELLPDEEDESPMDNDFGDEMPDSGVPEDLGQLVQNLMEDYAERNAGLLAGKGSFNHALEEARKKPPIYLSTVIKQLRDIPGSPDFDYRKPSNMDVFGYCFGQEGRMPVLFEQENDALRELIIGIDASASMSKEEKLAALSIARDGFKYVKRNLRLLEFTDHIVQDTLVTPTTSLHLSSTGGTRIASVAEHIDAKQYRPSCVVIITDGIDPSADAVYMRWRHLNRLRTIIVRNPRRIFPGVYYHVSDIK